MALRGSKAHLARLNSITRNTERFVSQALFVGGQRIQVEAQISISAGSVSGKGHVPSVSPDPPNQDTGVLANAIETVSKAPLVVEVSSNAPYSQALEYSTSKMGERPFMRRARDAKRAEVVDLVERAVKQAVRQSRSRKKD